MISEESQRKVGNAKGSYGWGQNFTENSFEYQEQEGKGTWRKFYILHFTCGSPGFQTWERQTLETISVSIFNHTHFETTVVYLLNNVIYSGSTEFYWTFANALVFVPPSISPLLLPFLSLCLLIIIYCSQNREGSEFRFETTRHVMPLHFFIQPTPN